MTDILLIIITISTYIFIFCVTKFIVMPYFNKKNELLEKDVKNKANTFFSTIDIVSVDKLITEYIQKYIDRYIVYKFISNKKLYINEESTDTMIKDVTKNVMRDISELYVFYFKLLYSIDDTEDLIRYVHDKVMIQTIDSVSSYNKSIE